MPYSWLSEVDPEQKIYPVNEVAMIFDALTAAGVSPADALQGVNLSPDIVSSPATRVSLNQILQCCRNALNLSRAPFFAYEIGLRFHVSTYGMYGFGILSSTSFRQAVQFAVKYHELAAPLVGISFQEDDRYGIWSIEPAPHPAVEASLYEFVVEMAFGIAIALHRDVMGPDFIPKELRVAYQPSHDLSAYRTAFGCDMLFGQATNELVFDVAWLNAVPQLGNRITHSVVVLLCDKFLSELQLQKGMAGQVRRVLLVNLARPTRLEAVARQLKIAPRTLRRKLREEKTSFREVLDDLRMHAAIKFLRYATDERIDRRGNRIQRCREFPPRLPPVDPAHARRIQGQAAGCHQLARARAAFGLTSSRLGRFKPFDASPADLHMSRSVRFDVRLRI